MAYIGVDLQRDRIECITTGFDENDEWYFLDHKILYGSPLADEVWRDLDDLLAERYPFGTSTIGRSATCIDVGDGNIYARAMSYCTARRDRIVIPIKGASGSRPPLAHAALKRARGLHICGVESLKARIFDRINRKQGLHFSDALPGAWFEQLLSERAVVRYTRGQPQRVFERYPGRLAEALDCTVYAVAARTLINTPAVRREAELTGGPLPPAIPTTIRSAWLEGRR